MTTDFLTPKSQGQVKVNGNIEWKVAGGLYTIEYVRASKSLRLYEGDILGDEMSLDTKNITMEGLYDLVAKTENYLLQTV